MLPSASVLRRILWPKQASMFVIIGGAAGLIGDMTSFFASFISPPILAVLFLAAALATAWVCFNKAADVDVANASDVESVVECGACDALRFSLFAAVAFGLFMLIGQGQSATETVGEKLGLIQKDVAEISGNVRQLTDMTQSQRIRSNPKTAEDYFANAWIYSNLQRDQSKAHASLVEMYGRFGPRKLDAAELFFSTGRELKGRNELITQMAQIAEQRKDATLLVVWSGRTSRKLVHVAVRQLLSRGTVWLVIWKRLSRGQVRISDTPQVWSCPPVGKRRVENGMRISTS